MIEKTRCLVAGFFILVQSLMHPQRESFQARLTGLKKTVFFEMLDTAGRVFIVVRHSENVVIGNRGFTEEEKKNGIVLVFNRSMNFSWDDSGITSSLVFGTSPQKCYIPPEDIVVIYSPELNSEFISAPHPAEFRQKGETAGPRKEETTGPKVVSVDFKKKKQKSGAGPRK